MANLFLPIVLTGGTIASRRDPISGAARAVASGEELLAAVPELRDLAAPTIVPFAQVNSWNFTPAQMVTLAQRVADLLDDDTVPGVVITHGTDTVEETAMVLHTLLPASKPVVLTVAMRSSDEAGADGPRNLLDAARVAVARESRDRGVLLVANETIHAGRWVTKTHTTNPATFQSPGAGPVGRVTTGGVRFYGPPLPHQQRAVDFRGAASLPDVLVIKAVAGSDARLIEWAVQAGFRGLVIEGSGAGNVPEAMMPGLERAIAAGLPVVLTSRCLEGAVTPVYGGGSARGGGRDLQAMGLILTDGLPAQKARMVLMLALQTTSDVDVIRGWFAESVAGLGD